MRTDDINLVNNGINSLLNLIRNMPFMGTREQIQLSQILFLDKYYRDYVTFETGVIDVQDALNANNILLYNSLKEKYSYAYDSVGIFREKKAGDIAISELSADILRRLGIQCNIVKGAFVLNSFNGEYYYPHQWNEIKLGDKWYCYDFTLNIISEKWRDKDVKKALKFIKMPVTPVDYSFVKILGKNIKLGGYNLQDKHSTEFNKSLLNSDFSKYNNMDRSVLLSEYMKVEKLSKAMNMEK